MLISRSPNDTRRRAEGLVRNASDPERDPGDEDTTVSPGEERQPPRTDPDADVE